MTDRQTNGRTKKGADGYFRVTFINVTYIQSYSKTYLLSKKKLVLFASWKANKEIMNCKEVDQFFFLYTFFFYKNRVYKNVKLRFGQNLRTS